MIPSNYSEVAVPISGKHDSIWEIVEDFSMTINVITGKHEAHCLHNIDETKQT